MVFRGGSSPISGHLRYCHTLDIVTHAAMNIDGVVGKVLVGGFEPSVEGENTHLGWALGLRKGKEATVAALLVRVQG